MKKSILLFSVFSLLFFSFRNIKDNAPKDSKYYEMRTYYAEEGKMEDLLSRFRNNTMSIFKKHGMTNVGYWLPIDNKENKLVYVLSYPNKESREKAWKDFSNDSEWKKVASESEKNGMLVAKVENIFLKTTDFSPSKISEKGSAKRVFELRTYKTTAGHLLNLLTRFRDHTCKLFEKHEMTNLWYWTPIEKEQGADNTLIYFLAHKSKEAGLESFKSFGADPAWTKVREESEKVAGSSLTESVKSEYMNATDFSPIQ